MLVEWLGIDLKEAQEGDETFFDKLAVFMMMLFGILLAVLVLALVRLCVTRS